MERDGVDTKRPLLYGYFFFDKNRANLEKLGAELVKDNYTLARIEKTDSIFYILHVEKIEPHTRESLLKREIFLEAMAKQFTVELYDGWDVGNIDPTKPVTSNVDFENSLKNKSDKELFETAINLYDQGIYSKAVIAFENCIKRNYNTDTSYYKTGVSLIELGEINAGIEKLENAFKINQSYFKACFNIGAVCAEHLQYEKSLQFYRKAAILEPGDDRAIYGVAAAQFVLKQFSESKSNCEKALQLNPDNQNARKLLKMLEQNR